METMELLKKARKQAGMTQKEFSEYFGIPCRTIEDWERVHDIWLIIFFD